MAVGAQPPYHISGDKKRKINFVWPKQHIIVYMKVDKIRCRNNHRVFMIMCPIHDCSWKSTNKAHHKASCNRTTPSPSFRDTSSQYNIIEQQFFAQPGSTLLTPTSFRGLDHSSHDSRVYSHVVRQSLKMSSYDDLFVACRDGNITKVRELLSAGLDPRQRWQWWGSWSREETPLHTACR